MSLSNSPMYDMSVNTNHKTRASADHQHRTCAVQPALLIKGTMSTTDEEVRDAETQAADDEVSNGPDEGLALRLSDTLYRVLRQGLVRTEVDLPPLRYTSRLDNVLNKCLNFSPIRRRTRETMRVWTTMAFVESLLSKERSMFMSSWHSCGAKGGGAGRAEGRRQSGTQSTSYPREVDYTTYPCKTTGERPLLPCEFL